MRQLAGEPVSTIRTRAPGNDQSFGGIKSKSEAGWTVARQSGTEDVHKVYAESFRDQNHLKTIQQVTPTRHREGLLISMRETVGATENPQTPSRGEECCASLRLTNSSAHVDQPVTAKLGFRAPKLAITLKSRRTKQC